MNSYTRLALKLCSPIFTITFINEFFEKKSERNWWKNTFANRKVWPREFSFLLQVWFPIFFTENHIKWFIFKYFQRSSWFKHFIYTTLSDEFSTECHQHYMPSPTSISTEIIFIKPSDQYLVECKPHNFLLHVVNPWRSFRLVFYLNYFVEKYIIYISILGMIKLFKITCWRFASLYLFYPSRWWNRQIFMVLHELRWVMKFRN